MELTFLLNPSHDASRRQVLSLCSKYAKDGPMHMARDYRKVLKGQPILCKNDLVIFSCYVLLAECWFPFPPLSLDITSEVYLIRLKIPPSHLV